MNKILIKGATVLRAEGTVDVTDILIEGDRIAKIGAVAALSFNVHHSAIRETT